MMGELIPFPARWEGPPLTYAQMANHLGVSRRFLQARVAEGMPAGYDWSGRKRMFKPSEVEEWLRKNRGKTA